jgi:hypothetical protein
MKYVNWLMVLPLVVASCSSDSDECNSIAAEAGEDQYVTSTTLTLQASDPGGEQGTWEIVAGEGGELSDVNDPQATLSGMSGEIYRLRWTVPGCKATSVDSVQVGFIPDRPFVTSISEDTIFNGEVIVVQGYNFEPNLSSSSQLKITAQGGAMDGAEIYFTILSVSENEIRAAVHGANGGMAGKYALSYLHFSGSLHTYATPFTIEIEDPDPADLYVSSSLSATQALKGGTVSFGIRNASGLGIDDFQVKLRTFDYTTGLGEELPVEGAGIASLAWSATMDQLYFVVPNATPSDSYHVLVTIEGGKTFLAGYVNPYLNVQ